MKMKEKPPVAQIKEIAIGGSTMSWIQW